MVRAHSHGSTEREVASQRTSPRSKAPIREQGQPYARDYVQAFGRGAHFPPPPGMQGEAALSLAALLRMQRVYGNQAVQRFMERANSGSARRGDIRESTRSSEERGTSLDESAKAEQSRGLGALALVRGGEGVADELLAAPWALASQRGRSRDAALVQRNGTAAGAGAAATTVKEEHRKALAAIQGNPMYALLPLVQGLPSDVRADEDAGQAVGGLRLVTAMRAVAAKGKPWADFAAAHNGELSALPVDQIGDIITFLGAPKDAHYYKADEFGGQFDGAVDPAAGVVTLYFRVRFVMDGVRFGAAPAGTPEWERETREGRQKFEAEFKRVVEQAWTGKGSVKPACPIGPIKAFQTKVVVTVVESGEHTVFNVFSAGAGGRSNAKPGEGSLKTDDTETKEHTQQVVDPTGKRPEQLKTTQVPAAHEFGHAVGLHHPRCEGGDDKCYGVTAEERRDIMGTGDMPQVIKRGGIVIHDDFQPFERIAKRWGQDALPGALAKCNAWSAG